MTTTSTPRRRMAPEERERAIVDSAIALALEQGLDSLTVRAIGGRAGVTPALVAHYRPSMDAFVAEVFGAIVAAERDELLGAFEPEASMRASLQRLVGMLLDETRDEVTLVWVQSWVLGARNAALGARVREEMDRWQVALADVIARAAAADESDAAAAVDAQEAAWMLLAMVDGMNAHSLVKWSPLDREALSRRTLAALLDPVPGR